MSTARRASVKITGMGASGWDYVVPYSEDMAGVLRSLQERVLRDDHFYWESEDDEFYDPDEPFPGPKPTTLAELATLKVEAEDFWEVGTHSVLDLDRVIGPDDEDHDGTLRPLPEQEVVATFGTRHPTRQQWESAYQGGMGDVPFARKWSGLYLALYSEGKPTEIAIWGFSGD
jgi:hypothetical protein